MRAMSGSGWRKLEQVVCRVESQADERPIKFRWNNNWIKVDQVCSVWIERGPAEKDPAYRVFKVKSILGEHLLRVQLGGWIWEWR